MSATHRELLQAVLDAPHDLEPRMVLADFYMQAGDPRGELISAQCKLAGRGLSPSTRVFFAKRVSDLLDEHGDVWAAPARGIARGWEFRCGFIHKIVGTSNKVLGGWEPLWEVEPVVHLELTSVDARVAARLAESPLLGRLRYLTIRGNIGDKGARALAESPHLARLERLNLKDTGIGDEGVRSLAAARDLRCKSLALTGNEISDQGAKLLAQSPVLEAVEALYLSRTQIGDEGVAALARSPHLGKLDTLALGTLEELTDQGAQALIDSKGLPLLRRLEVDVCHELSSKVRSRLRKRWPRVRI